MDILDRFVLGTAQFGMDYGITNLSGRPQKDQVFKILELAWREGVRHFDTAPGYDSEALLGEFIVTHGLNNEVVVLTKLPKIDKRNCQSFINASLESSLQKLGCKIDVLFFHHVPDSDLLLKDSEFFKTLLEQNSVNQLGVSVYDPIEVKSLTKCELELAFQFPFNLLDRRFSALKMLKGSRYARSIFLQGLLASGNCLRTTAPQELIKLQKQYHTLLQDHRLNAIATAISFVKESASVDYFLVGVNDVKQLKEILNSINEPATSYKFIEPLMTKFQEKWIDPRKWI